MARALSTEPDDGVINGFRWCVLGRRSHLDLLGLAVSLAVAAFFLWFGVRRFRRTEKSFADLI
jgi:lipopolysaccharide transport system permease protein